MFEIITPKTRKELDEYFYLRWYLLRKEWGGERGSEMDEDESISHHRSAVNESGLAIGVGRIHFRQNLAQVRYMATSRKFRGIGVGSKILNELEKVALGSDADKVFLNSRESAVDFYIRNGYEVIGETSYSFGDIMHYRMEKVINKS